MRPVSLADLEVGLRALLAIPADLRLQLAVAMIEQAGVADRHRAATGAMHPDYGSGTLMSAAARYPLLPRPAAYGAQEISAFAILLKAIATRGVDHED